MVLVSLVLWFVCNRLYKLRDSHRLMQPSRGNPQVAQPSGGDMHLKLATSRKIMLTAQSYGGGATVGRWKDRLSFHPEFFS